MPATPQPSDTPPASGRRGSRDLSAGPSVLRQAGARSVSPGSAAAAGSGDGAAPRPPQTLTKEVLLGATNVQRGNREGLDAYLGRITHLQLQGQRLGPFLGDALELVPGVSVLYAYDNLLTSMVGLQHLKRLSLLYLQNNRITSMVGLEVLPTLRVLHLGHNRLTRVEGLEGLTHLEELHVPNQRPLRSTSGGLGGEESTSTTGSTLEFCPDSIEAVASTLRVLGAAGNGLRDVSVLAPLQGLTSLDLSANELQKVDDVRELLTGRSLRKVHLEGNPLAFGERKYRALVVLLAQSIEELDGRPVLPQERDFMRRLEEQKRKLQAQRELAVQKQRSAAPSPAAPPRATAAGKGSPSLFAAMAAGGRTSAPPILQDLLVS